MADMTFKVTPAELIKKSGEFHTHRQQMLRIIEEAKTHVNSLKGVWTGSAADEFQVKFKAMYTTCDSILNEIQKHENVLKEAAQAYTASENAVKSQVDKLPSTGIFK